MNLFSLLNAFVDLGCQKVYAKNLSENDNSKNQVYVGGSSEILNIIPSKEIQAAVSSKGISTFKAKLDFSWLVRPGVISSAPCSQLIFYPQYPEVRFSGFLKGCENPPSELMSSRIRGRVLFIGVAKNSRIIGYVAAGDSELAEEFRQKHNQTDSIFVEVDLPTLLNTKQSREKLLIELKRINELGWIDSKQLDRNGIIRPCNAPQCGGFTLEAELGISKNSLAEPDFMGWEIKQHAVSNLQNLTLSGGAITLFTPEPTGGFYKDCGVKDFIRKFGYPDRRHRPDRLNFGGVHRVAVRNTTTGLTLQMLGYDMHEHKIVNVNGGLALISDNDEVAASWSFENMLSHWTKKHLHAVYVPSKSRKEPELQYHYGSSVRMAEHTEPLLLLKAMADGLVFYDPGIKMENVSTIPVIKRRSQFRVASKDLPRLYQKFDIVEL